MARRAGAGGDRGIEAVDVDRDIVVDPGRDRSSTPSTPSLRNWRTERMRRADTAPRRLAVAAVDETLRMPSWVMPVTWPVPRRGACGLPWP